MKDRDEAERDKIETRLHLPPPGVAPTSGRWSATAQMDSFRSLKAALGK